MEFQNFQPGEPGEYLRPTTPKHPQHQQWMQMALEQAHRALATGDIPIGAIVVDAHGQVIGAGYNQREATGDPTAHAEVLAIRQAAAYLGSWRLDSCTLVVTVEPCIMCAGSLLMARISRVVFGAWEEKMGATGSVYDVLRDRRLPLGAEVYSGVCEQECVQVVQEFFRSQRSEKML